MRWRTVHQEAMGRFRRMLKCYADGETRAADVTGVLADALHYCVFHGLEFDALLAEARESFEAEKLEEPEAG